MGAVESKISGYTKDGDIILECADGTTHVIKAAVLVRDGEHFVGEDEVKFSVSSRFPNGEAYKSMLTDAVNKMERITKTRNSKG